MKKLLGSILTVFILFQLTGCLSFVSTKKPAMDYVKGDVEYEIRVGSNADTKQEIADIDVDIDKDMFVDLYNEEAQYDPNAEKYHLDRQDLKLNSEKDHEKWKEMLNSEINIRMIFDDGLRSVSVYELDSQLYFFVVCMGGRSDPDEEGYYYMEMSDDLADYWEPVIDEIREEAEEDHLKRYGSFTIDFTSSYDEKYTVHIIRAGDNRTVQIQAPDIKDTTMIGSFAKKDFYGVCWDKDSYDIWVQLKKEGIICYRFDDGEWEEDPEAEVPDYIIPRSGK